jgi:acyl-coenzyme A synthetase/AMP-(fatty) acid ligase
VHVHQAVVAHHATGGFALDLQPDDVFWCTADPGWVTGTSYGIISPLTHGVTSIVDEAELDAERWYRILRDERVTVWYTAPTAIRMLMRLGAAVAREYQFQQLRLIASVGEPLNPEAVVWGENAFGLPIHDNWWQITERPWAAGGHGRRPSNRGRHPCSRPPRQRRTPRRPVPRRRRPAPPATGGTMNEQQAREVVLQALREIAPEVSADEIDPLIERRQGHAARGGHYGDAGNARR